MAEKVSSGMSKHIYVINDLTAENIVFHCFNAEEVIEKAQEIAAFFANTGNNHMLTIDKMWLH